MMGFCRKCGQTYLSFRETCRECGEDVKKIYSQKQLESEISHCDSLMYKADRDCELLFD
jgi:uncharacterized membrane protein YvbJ